MAKATNKLDRKIAKAEKLCAAGDHREAVGLYRDLLQNHSDNVDLMRRCADAMKAAGQKKKAAKMRLKADEKETAILCETAEAAYMEGDYGKALSDYQRAHALTPDLGEAVWGIADCHASLGDNDTAIDWYRRYLEIEPDEPEALHMLASLGVGAPPERASEDYVTTYFDRFAPDFDDMLVKQLEYRIPERIVETAEWAFRGELSSLTVLDVGCGTGLCGEALDGRVRRIDGVDLSPEMLKVARKRKIYRRLAEADIEDYLAETSRRYDLIVSGDVLVYLGALEKTISGFANSLAPGGVAVFSLEAREGGGFKLTESGRYAHSRDYVREVAAAAGLTERGVSQVTARLEYGEPVKGDIWVFGLDG